MSSAQAAPYTFPAPIGGVPFDSDFVPSIIFALFYAAVTILAIYRLVRSKSRTLCALGSLAFVGERIIIYSLRAKQSHTPSEDNSKGLTQYWQATYAIGYLSVLTDIAAILRSLLVNTTLGVTPGLASESSDSLVDQRGQYPPNQQGGLYGVPRDEDQPRARFWYRRICGFLTLFSWIPVIMGTVMGIQYPKAETDANTANMVQSLRYATTGLAFVEILIIQVLSVWSYFCVPRIRRSGALTMAVISTLLNIVSVYRLVVMRLETTSLTSRGPHSLNDPGSKATFYIFHAAPEWLAAAILFAVNVREMFGTGLKGDYRSTDKKSAT